MRPDLPSGADLARGGGGRAKLKDLRHNGDDHKPPFLAGLDIGSLLKEYHGSSTSWSPLQGMGHCTSGKPLNMCYRQGMILLKNSRAANQGTTPASPTT